LTPTAGRWSPDERHLYFLAANMSRQQWDVIEHPNVLVAVNELANKRDRGHLDMLLERGKRVLLDSGIFWLTNEHRRRHGLRMDDALALAPSEIDGFAELRDAYLELTATYGERLWGYIELDQGGAVNKRITRADLEAQDRRPIPVYHPLNDGWDYFDELAESYDRICFGNVVQADVETRLRLVHTAAERHRRYPELWIHLLGLTPNTWMNALAADSCDSSTWLSVLRWDGYTERAMLAPVSQMPSEWKYRLGTQANERDDPAFAYSDKASLAMSSVGCAAMQLGWQHWQRRLLEEGVGVDG
jgi:hypothetical protein